ncbi:PstS family phosphate ABC transporter substrate-binding protein [Ectobacillus ponti]|uniref:Phosphate-binding protein n=1 Tax=Ectobacillus ponti TaxID=2961894 RepID=A0AA42BR79_9BACI|nr:PstS family phosphate ABC transporter substrate-binding protein [Ectobacillus ponti]MCP8967138.1 PstS family phosphate ABC transporter substrate-binding protein [Ectobacillus ponti]
MRKVASGAAVFLLACAAWLAAAAGQEQAARPLLKGEVRMDGSSTVFPIMEAISEEYARRQPAVKTPISISGTGGGFHRFSKGEVDLTNASRAMKREERMSASAGQVAYTEFQIAYDGLSIVVSKDNNWIQNITEEELRQLWREEGRTKKWSDIRPDWPEQAIRFYAPGVDSGTYDYFQETILGDRQMVKSVAFSEDDNVLVRGVMSDPYAIGFLGFAYYSENKDRVRAVRVNGVLPTKESIKSGLYAPLSRPLYIYANNRSIKEKACVYDYLRFALQHGADLVEETGYVALPQRLYQQQVRQLEAVHTMP